MASMSSSQLLATAAILLTNGRTGCMRKQTSAHPRHPTNGAESGLASAPVGGLREEVGRREASKGGGQQVGTGDGRGGGVGRKREAA
jgi:hypothetical protein